MKHSESIAKLAAALVKAQAELRAVGLDSVNPHFRNRYASLDNIIETVRPTLAKYGLAVVQGATTPESDANNKVTAFTVETMLVHESGEWILNAVVMPLAKADPQGAGGALTYGRRYGISALLSLATDEDDDGNQAAKRSGEGGGAGRERGAAEPATVATHTTTATAPTPAPENFLMPIGKNRGKPLRAISSDDLRSAAEWINEKSFHKKHADLLVAIGKVLAERAKGELAA